MTTESNPTSTKERTDGGNIKESPIAWGGKRETYQHESQPKTTILYEPPERFHGGPLDFYITEEVTSRDTKHLVDGPEYREAVAEVFTDNQTDNKNTESSICGLKKIHLGFKGGLSHFLELLADIGFDGIKSTVPDLHDRPKDTAYHMISGSPLTVYQTCCEKCKRSYKTRYTTKEIEAEVEKLTEEL